MIWQDIVIAVGQWFFAVSLLPTLFSKNELPPLTTSIPTGTILLVFGATFYTLGLTNAWISSVVVALVWLAIGFRKLKGRLDYE